MPHLDPEELSLLALYDDWDDAVSRKHLEECPACASEFAALRRTVDAVKTTPDTSRLSVPGPQVWDGIHRELGLSASVREDPLAAAGHQGHLPPSAAAPPSNIALPADISQARAARKGRAWWQRSGTWLVAAAAAVVVALGGIWALNRPAQPLPLAEAQLTPLASFSATGSARVVEAQDGARTLEVQLSKDEAQGYQEVWLIAPDLSRLVSLGVMNADTGTFQVPAGLELSEYPIVDVSDEPVDGNPAHSSVSIVRGTLTS
jgi:anti-sigma-K factor RskA